MDAAQIQHAARAFGPLFLASVRSAAEARTALSAGAAILDCKDPEKGSLGALNAIETRAIVDAAGGRVLVSATLGDLPPDPALMVNAARGVSAAGAGIVKAGFFGDGDPFAAIAALGRAELGSARLVAVLMADREPDFEIMPALAAAGFIGVMLDTADKTRGALPEVMARARLGEFINIARRHNLAAGLAGSLRISDVAGLVALGPDILGFRGALCDGNRTGALSARRVADVKAALDAARSSNVGIEKSVA